MTDNHRDRIEYRDEWPNDPLLIHRGEPISPSRAMRGLTICAVAFSIACLAMLTWAVVGDLWANTRY